MVIISSKEILLLPTDLNNTLSGMPLWHGLSSSDSVNLNI